MQSTLTALGGYFYPLRDFDDVACLLEASARIPANTPGRARRIYEYMLSSLRDFFANGFQLAQILTRIAVDRRDPESRRFEEVVSSIPAGDDQVLVTDRTTCIVCGEALIEAVTQHGKHHYASPTLYAQDGGVRSTLLWLRCSHCKAHHYVSYAVGGDILPDGTAQVYPNWSAAKYENQRH